MEGSVSESSSVSTSALAVGPHTVTATYAGSSSFAVSSGTTAHAVLKANAKDGGNRRFILVEGEDYADTLTAERVRRAIRGSILLFGAVAFALAMRVQSVQALWFFTSDLVFVLLFHVIRYRRDVVRTNLRNSFPEKSTADLAGEFAQKRATLAENRRKLEESQRAEKNRISFFKPRPAAPLAELAPLPPLPPEPDAHGAPPPSAPVGSLSFADLWSQLDTVLGQSQQRCAAPPGAGSKLKLTLAITIHPSGASSVSASAAPRGKRTASCLQTGLQSLRVQPFTGSAFPFTRTVEINAED